MTSHYIIFLSDRFAELQTEHAAALSRGDTKRAAEIDVERIQINNEMLRIARGVIGGEK